MKQLDPFIPTDPGGNPEDFSELLKNKDVTIQCTWANAFATPEWIRGNCIRSYDRKMLPQSVVNSGSVIATLTGVFYIDEKEVAWLQAKLKHTNRMDIGWFRESDIYFEGKEGYINPADVKKPTKSALVWLTGGLTLLSILR